MVEDIIKKAWYYCENCDREFLYEDVVKGLLEKPIRHPFTCPICKKPIKELNFH